MAKFTVAGVAVGIVKDGEIIHSRGYGLKSVDTVCINVTGNNTPPVADAGNDQDVDSGIKVSLEGSNSYDPDEGDEIKAYRWKQIFGTPVTLDTPVAVNASFDAVFSNENPENNVLEFELTVTDSNGLTNTDKVFVNINKTEHSMEKRKSGSSGCFIKSIL